MVSSGKTKEVYICDGSQTVFPITFETPKDDYGNAKNVVVFLTDTNGQVAELTKGSSYTISGLNVVTSVAYPEGSKISIIRQMDFTQPMDLIRTGKVDLETLEFALDKLTYMAQELKEKIERAFLAPVSIEAVQAISIDAILSLQTTIQRMVEQARDWAGKEENLVVQDGKYSALHYAAKAEEFWRNISTYISDVATVYAIPISTYSYETTEQFYEHSVPEGSYSAYVQLVGSNTQNVHHIAVELSTSAITVRIYHVDNDSALPREGTPPIKFGQKLFGAFAWGDRQTIQMIAFLR